MLQGGGEGLRDDVTTIHSYQSQAEKGVGKKQEERREKREPFERGGNQSLALETYTSLSFLSTWSHSGRLAEENDEEREEAV